MRISNAAILNTSVPFLTGIPQGAFYFALRNIDLSLAHAFRQGFLISQPIDRSFAVQRRPKMRVFRSAAPDLDGAGGGRACVRSPALTTGRRLFRVRSARVLSVVLQTRAER